MIGCIVWFISIALGFCFYFLNAYFDNNLTSVIVSLNIMTFIIFTSKMYKIAREDFGIIFTSFWFALIALFHAFFGFCLFYVEPSSLASLMSTMLSLGITFSFIFILIYCRN